MPQDPVTRAAALLLPRGRVLGAVLGVALALAVVLGIAGPAAAHVTIAPATVEGGGFAVVVLRVPNERDDASTTRVRVLLPKDHPIGSVSTTPVPGWRVATRTRALAEPIEVFGRQLDRVVAEVTWTATGGTGGTGVGSGIGPGQFQDFAMDLGPLPESGELVFPTVQRYSSGEQVAWNEVAVGDAEPEHPAPVLRLAPVAQKASGDSSDDQSASSSADDTGPSTALVVLALVLAGLALVGSLLALAGVAGIRRRRARPGP